MHGETLDSSDRTALRPSVCVVLRGVEPVELRRLLPWCLVSAFSPELEVEEHFVAAQAALCFSVVLFFPSPFVFQHIREYSRIRW